MIEIDLDTYVYATDEEGHLHAKILYNHAIVEGDE